MTRKMVHILIATFAVCALGSGAYAQQIPSTVETQSGPLHVEIVAEGLSSPWGAVFLPDESMLVTERGGSLRRITESGSVSQPIQGTPEVIAQGQGGLLDVALDPQFAENRLVYLSFSEARDNEAATSVGRGKLNTEATAIDDFEVIFRQEPAVPGGNHFGSRLVFSPDGLLFVTLGERFNHRKKAQDPTDHLGSIVRIKPDGSIPPDNPFVDKQGADEIWSYGHRNVEGAAIHPQSGELWVSEMGPRGGDEVNIPKAGGNYGWPVVSHGERYSGKNIPDPSTRPEFVEAVYFWNPVISPSGIAFANESALPQWKGDLLLAGLSAHAIVRLDLEGEKAVGEERLEMAVRMRDVLFGPDGRLYALTDGPGGKVIRLSATNG